MSSTAPSFRPLYLQIKGLLKASLAAGEWRPAEAIPSEQELAGRFGVSQGTVRKAIDALAADNLVVRRQGNRCLQLFSRHFSITVTINDVVQMAFHRCFVRHVSRRAVAFELLFIKTASSSKKGSQGLPRGIIVEDYFVALPRPWTDPRCNTCFFTHPTIE